MTGTAEFSKFAGMLSAALQQHILLGSAVAHWNSITSTSFVELPKAHIEMLPKTHLTSLSRMSGSR